MNCWQIDNLCKALFRLSCDAVEQKQRRVFKLFSYVVFFCTRFDKHAIVCGKWYNSVNGKSNSHKSRQLNFQTGREKKERPEIPISMWWHRCNQASWCECYAMNMAKMCCIDENTHVNQNNYSAQIHFEKKVWFSEHQATAIGFRKSEKKFIFLTFQLHDF